MKKQVPVDDRIELSCDWCAGKCRGYVFNAGGKCPYCKKGRLTYDSTGGVIMKRMIVIAVFIGAEGSCGFMRGHVYKLEIRRRDTDKNYCVHCEGASPGYCEYESLFSFLSNWSSVSILP